MLNGIGHNVALEDTAAFGRAILEADGLAATDAVTSSPSALSSIRGTFTAPTAELRWKDRA